MLELILFHQTLIKFKKKNLYIYENSSVYKKIDKNNPLIFNIL